ncbi:WD40 repeat domain-containing protein [Candidatus Chloroploca sp. Khr17]|uniref:WD40 repeat domain-containing protein n=1 Tax=Candidatus Chloroploca sp. Khr17 TaxID=2496869 RepID=UPI00101D06DB|nr:WD40 repeat domain-containing protein [Candidatus Chloroploca sp. Khr17]
MTPSQATDVEANLLFIAVPEDLPVVQGVISRLQIDGFAITLVTQLPDLGASPRLWRETLAQARAVVLCLSRRSMPNDQPPSLVTSLTELLNLTPAPDRFIVTLKLTSCTLPASLRATPTLDLFSARSYERFREMLHNHLAATTTPPPVTAPETPAVPSHPALVPEGSFALDELEEHGLLRRLGRGVPRAVFLIDQAHALVISGGGPVLLALGDGTPRWAIDHPTHCASLSPNGQLLALAAGTRIMLWELANGQLHSICSGHTGMIQSLAFAPDERLIASGGRDRRVRLWRLSAGQPVVLATLPEHSDTVTALAFNADGTLLATGSADQSVRIWRTFDRVLIQTLTGHGGTVEALAFSPDKTLLAAGSRGRRVRLWETATWKLRVTLEGHEGAVETLAFAPTGEMLATGATDGTLRLWQTATGALLRIVGQHQNPLTSTTFSPDGSLIASLGEDNRLHVWQTASSTHVTSLRPLSGRVTSLTLNAEGTLLALGSSEGAVTIHELTAEGGTRIRQQDHVGPIISAAFYEPDHLITAASDRTIRACTTTTGASRILWQTHGSNRVACLASNGRLLACTDGTGTVQLWRITPGETAAGGQFWRVLRGLQGRPRLIRFDAQSQAILVATDESAIQIWHLNDLEAEQERGSQHLPCQSDDIRSLGTSLDGRLLAIGSSEGTIQLWHRQEHRTLGMLEGIESAVTSLTFAGGDHTLVAGDAEGRLHFWRITQRNWRPRRTNLVHAHAGAIEHLLYNATQQHLISGSRDGTVRIWKA